MSNNNTYEENIADSIILNDAEDDEIIEKKHSRKTKSFKALPDEGFTANIYDWIRCVLFAIAIVIVCLTFIFRLVDVDGSSMYATLSSNDKVIVSNLFYTPKNQDIVVISHGEKYANPIIKRVIATEGQKVKFDYEGEKIIVDGIVLDEPYITGTTFSGNFGDNQIPEEIPEGKVLVLGDNRRVSLDSRSTEVGLIDVENVIGKAQFVVFPFDRIGGLY